MIAVLAQSSAPASAATALYPNLRTLAPRDLRFARADVDPGGSTVNHNVLRFSNTVWNAGDGPLEMRGQIDSKTKSGAAVQRVYNDSGGFSDFASGSFYWHEAHQHYHYDDWGRYELWTKADYDAWIASGRTEGTPVVGSKTTSCMIDEEFIRNLPNQPYPATYHSSGCFPSAQGAMLQGVSVGWGDTYDYFRFEQWIDLGPSGSLPDGQYVLRSVTDPLNKVYESPGKADAGREGQVDNEGITNFSVQGGKLEDSNPPRGSVRINDIDAGTPAPNVTVKVLGRDDISGVTQVRLSNNGSAWSNPQTYTGTGSTAQAIGWNITNSTYGGNDADGVKTVYVQFRDASGKWSAAESDSIELNRRGDASAYSNAVLGDSPSGYWRLGETSGSVAADASGSDNGTYENGVVLGQSSLLAGDSANRSVRFDGVNDHVHISSSSPLSPTARISLEAWIKPTALPAAGSFASILTKAESYSLQFNGPRLEFTIMQNGARRRLQAPAGAVQAGQTYHVVGTYDGDTQRLYINGSEVVSSPLSGPASTNQLSVYIGSWNGQSEFFKGTIDEPAVYGAVLSLTQVDAHYQAGIGGPPPDPTVKAPSDLSATAISDTQVSLSWKDNSSNEGEFLIERDTSPSFPAPVVNSVWTDSTLFSDLGLTPGVTYYYRVKARNATESSGYSNTVTVTTLETTPAPSGYSAAVVADSPAGYWRLGEGSGTAAADQRGANPGVYVNSPALGIASLLGAESANHAVAFDGVDDHVRVDNSESLSPSLVLTLEAWIKPTSLPAAGSFASILTKAESYSLQFNGPRLEFTIMQNGARRRLQAPAGAVQAGQTYHVVGTYDGDTQRLYVNGNELASTPLSGPAGTNQLSVYIGSWNGNTEFFHGTIDEPAVYGAVLSPARVDAHYQAGTASEPPPPPPPPPPTDYSSAVLADSPVSYWRLGEASGATAADERGANPGAYANGPTLGVGSLLSNDAGNDAVRFDGSGDMVRVESSPSLDLGSPLTLEAWIKPNSFPPAGKYASVLTKAESFSLQFNGSRLEFTIMQNGARRRLRAPSGSVQAGQTYHLVGTYDGVTQRLYINGSQVASAALSGPASADGHRLYIASWAGGGEFFNGTVDEVAVYGAALGADRVNAHYEAGTASSLTSSLHRLPSSGLTLARSPISSGTGSYSIEGPPTYLDYCRLPAVA